MTTDTTTSRTGPSTAPTLDVDPFDHEVLARPGPFHAALREAGPVVRLSGYDTYAMGRYAQVHAALVDWQRFCSSAGVGLADLRAESTWRPPSVLLEADPPHHDAPRRVLAQVLSPRTLRGIGESWATAATELVDALLADGGADGVVEVEGMTALAEAFPLRVFPDAVGVGREGRENLLPYGDHAFNAFGPANDLVVDRAGSVGELSAWVDARCTREALAPVGLGADVWAAADRGEITPEQAPLVVRSMLTAGIDTTVHGIAAVLHALATHPDQWRALRAQPSLARTAFDEAVRWCSPVQTFFRTADTDVRVGDPDDPRAAGTVIPAGAKVLLSLGSANRDPRRWADPDAFDLGRDPSGHVGFGFGLHQCVGQHVARLEGQALLGALLPQVRRVEPAGDPLPHLNNMMSAWESLPLRLHLR